MFASMHKYIIFVTIGTTDTVENIFPPTHACYMLLTQHADAEEALLKVTYEACLQG
jgi:hypothetical protein